MNNCYNIIRATLAALYIKITNIHVGNNKPEAFKEKREQ